MKKNTSSQVVGAQMVATDTGTAFTSPVMVYVTGDNGSQAAASGAASATHKGNGWHTYAPTQAETNYTHVAYTFATTGAVPQTVQIYTSWPQTGDAFVSVTAFATALTASVAALPTLSQMLATPIETGVSVVGALRLLTSTQGGKTSGMSGGAAIIRDVNDSKDRVQATVDADGNRTAVTLNLT